MIIKKFQGKTENEATENAKKELGNGIVIMNVKNVKKKGLFSIFFPSMVEVTVALEEEKANDRPNQVPTMAPPLKETTGPLVPDVIWERATPATNTPAVQKESSAVTVTAKMEENKAIEERLDSLQELLEQKLNRKEEEKKSEEDKESKAEENEETATFMKLLYNTMIDNEVKEEYAKQIVEEIEKNAKPNMPMDYALSNVYQKLILKFGQPKLIQAPEQKPKMVFFIGPTGVGKTTTIAKIASKFCVEERKKVALLTADTYRIAAAEQLRTYANILEVPFRVVYSPEEVVQVLTEFKNYDYILVDTAGHSIQNREQKDDIGRLIHSIDSYSEKEVFLVVSATTKYRDLVKIAEAYQAMTEYKLIFTKLDETDAYGNLLNLRLHTGAALSYVTCGQNVPDDIEPFNPQTIVKQLLTGTQDE